MKIIKIYLDFPKSESSSLVGKELGLETYLKQVKNNIDYSVDKIILVFPNHKSMVSSSFIEGLFKNIEKEIGIVKTRELFEIQSKYQNIIKKFELEIFTD